MMDEAIQFEQKASLLLREAEIKAGAAGSGTAQVGKAASDLMKMREEVAVLMRRAKEKLSTAIGIANEVTASRVSLRHDEEKLREAYDELEGLRKVKESNGLVNDLDSLKEITSPPK